MNNSSPKYTAQQSLRPHSSNSTSLHAAQANSVPRAPSPTAKSNQPEIALVNHVEPINGTFSTLDSCQVTGSYSQESQSYVGCSPVDGSASCVGCGGPCCNPTSPTSPPINVQEYVFDGGDIPPGVVVPGNAPVNGLNVTDTVAHYETYDGRLCVTPTNRVPVYAPRFAAIRQVSGAVESENAQSTERILAPTNPDVFIDRGLANIFAQPLPPHSQETTRLIEALRNNNAGIPMASIVPPLHVNDARVPFENLEFFRTGQMQDQELAVLGQFLQNAHEWVMPESIRVEINNLPASEQLSAKSAQDVHVYELPPGTCSLRICKAASANLANSGDFIDFTIRFDNVGVNPLKKVVILDSLSPRLEYIEGSQQASLKAAPKFTTEPNDLGSNVLKWELAEELKPGEGGTIYFRCLVR